MSEVKSLTRMPVRRSLQPAAKISPGEMVSWQDRQGTEIALNVPLVRSLFKSKHPFTDAEILIFIHQARAKRANPFVGDLYLVKYAADSPAQLVTGYHYLIQAAKNNPAYAGFETWFVDEQGKRIPDGLETVEKVIACVCVVHIKGYDSPVKFVARLKEFRKSFPGTPWQGMPLVMLQKCAIGNAHRLSDPGLAGMYLPEEFGQEYAEEAVIEAESTEVEQPETPAAEASDTPQNEPPAEPTEAPQTEPANEAGGAPDSAKIDMMAAFEERLPKPAERYMAIAKFCKANGKKVPATQAVMFEGLTAQDLVAVIDSLPAEA